MKAIWNGVTIAESSATRVVEGNHYFPPESVYREYLKKNGKTYVCSWKGIADYYDVVAGEKAAPGAAWTYPEPKEAAQEIAGYFVFWKGVEVV
ncbi:DUF427 domain-containing protein [Candidatus Kaiserbacteria bacterium]|nr:DUF427 domain-containing protein [Candidatus Kaiserbacteria bacterium]